MPANVVAQAAAKVGAKLLKRVIKKRVRRRARNTSRRRGLLLGGGGLVLIGFLLASVIGGLLSVVAPIAGGGGAAYAAQCQTATQPSAEALADIPGNYLELYQRAARAIPGLDWSVLAGIGKMETNHGRFVYDHETKWGKTKAGDPVTKPGTANDFGAAGPMQIGSFDGSPSGNWWGSNGIDGNGDKTVSVWDPQDAIPGAAKYLQMSGVQQSVERAIFAYNHADWYVKGVLEWASKYADAEKKAAGNKPTPGQPGENTGGVVVPMKPGTYNISSGFGPRRGEFHRGIDMAASLGTPIYAMADGVVREAGPAGGFGQWIVIDHTINGQHISSVYGHMFPGGLHVTAGQTVKTEDHIADVGNNGESTGPHLHFEIWIGGRLDGGNATDPATWLSSNGAGTVTSVPDPNGDGKLDLIAQVCFENGNPGGGATGNGAWGGYQPGRIPLTAMCPLPWVPHKYLRCDAAEALAKLNDEYREAFGHNMVVTDAYRSYEEQADCYRRKPNLCAPPDLIGAHGWGLAVDVGDGIDSFGTDQHRWMQANGPGAGWVHPPWAEPNGSRPEAWHWEFGKRS